MNEHRSGASKGSIVRLSMTAGNARPPAAEAAKCSVRPTTPIFRFAARFEPAIQESEWRYRRIFIDLRASAVHIIRSRKEAAEAGVIQDTMDHAGGTQVEHRGGWRLAPRS